MNQHNNRFPNNFNGGGSGDGFSNWDSEPQDRNGDGDIFGSPSSDEFIDAIAESAGEDIDMVTRAIVLKLMWDFMLHMANVTPNARESMAVQVFDSAVNEVRRQWTNPEDGRQPPPDDVKLSNDAIDRAAVPARERFVSAYSKQMATPEWLNCMRAAFSKGVIPR